MTSKIKNLQLDRQLCFALYTATNSIVRRYNELLSQYDLTYPQYIVMLVLWENEDVSIMHVMRELKMDSGSLSPVIKRLEKKGFLTKQRKHSDERIVSLNLTNKARQLHPFISEVQTQVACHTGLPSNAFFELLDKLNQLAASLDIKSERV